MQAPLITPAPILSSNFRPGSPSHSTWLHQYHIDPVPHNYLKWCCSGNCKIRKGLWEVETTVARRHGSCFLPSTCLIGIGVPYSWVSQTSSTIWVARQYHTTKPPIGRRWECKLSSPTILPNSKHVKLPATVEGVIMMMAWYHSSFSCTPSPHQLLPFLI